MKSAGTKTKNFPRKCPLCSFESGMDRSLKTHLKKVHNDERPLEVIYVQYILNNVWPTCQCGCGKKLKFRKWNLGFASCISGHNASLYTFYDPEKAKEISIKRSKKLTGIVGWSRGLTKETDERIAKRVPKQVEGMKRYYSQNDKWSKGKTKDNDERIARQAKKIKQEFKEGKRVAWSKGKSKETDPRLAKMSKDWKENFASGKWEAYSKGHTKETHPGIANNIKARLALGNTKVSPERIKEILSSLTKTTVIGDPIKDYVKAGDKTFRVSCNRCGLEMFKNLITVKSDRCEKCDAWTSKSEKEIVDFVSSLGFNVECNDRKAIWPKELDVYIPEKYVAIEHHGLYYHSEFTVKAEECLKHDQKRQATITKNIKLLQIFEDEWNLKQDICKSIIRHALGKSEHKIHGRKCEVKEISNKQARQFLNKTHLEGAVNASFAFGLFHNNDLVGCITLRTPFKKKWQEANAIEIARMSFALNTYIIGGVSKLINIARSFGKNKGYERLMTYVDTRIGTGEGYVNAGMRYANTTPPRFWWTDGHTRLNRFAVRANKKEGITQEEAALNAGVAKIWGCANLILVDQL